ncbi:micronuclear linker histone polyprotein-like [Battus philenor]|uniref:micronuclear linker histone polyprotein-like n=1 Tax=Battus philenor TaxID=42288 RepID=UPI0035D03442
MECKDDGIPCSEAVPADSSIGVKRRRHAAESDLQLDVPIAVHFASHRKPVHIFMVPPRENNCHQITPAHSPFMSNMEEISYWVHTKRAPCLYNYDQITKQEQAHCSKFKSKNNVHKEVPLPKKKNKRKLVAVDEDTISTEQEKSANFFTTDSRQKAKNNGKAISIGSDLDFIIKESSTKVKPKRMRLERKSKTKLVQKNMNNIVSSTPKASAPRRSLRKLHKTLNSTQLESSIEVPDTNMMIDAVPPNIQESKHNESPSHEKVIDTNDVTGQVCNNDNEKPKHEKVLNGQFEDVSDVSGFTANYIRSTKIVSTKSPRNARNKLNRSYIKESQETPQKEDNTMVMCVNKSVNTGLPNSTVLNCSTDSSQNVINVVTLKSNEKSTRVSRATSLLKFMDSKKSDSKESLSNNDVKKQSNVKESAQSNGTSRYPKRNKNCTREETAQNSRTNTRSRSTSDKRKKTCKSSTKFNNSDRKENPEEEFVSRTRSGRKIGLKVRQPENSVLVLSNSTEQLSSLDAVNVAGPAQDIALDSSVKKRRSGRGAQVRKSDSKSRQLEKKDSLRDKSGFAACFSESDDESALVKQGKFFC